MKIPSIQQLFNILSKKPIKYGIVITLILVLIFIIFKIPKKSYKGISSPSHINIDTVAKAVDTNHLTTPTDENIDFEIVQDKSKLASYYELLDLKEWYTHRIYPPPFNYKMDLSSKTYMELRLLRNEIFARNGYLFKDATLRSYFNQFDWYQPIFDIDSFRVQINREEKDFLDKISKIQNEKFTDGYVMIGSNKMINMDYVVNLIQFDNLHDSLFQALKTKNFALASSNNEQLFYVYDENQYGFIPNFITTDLYLQVLHKYLSGLMQDIEEEKLIGIVTELLQNLYKTSNEVREKNNDKRMVIAIKWANTYLAIGLSAIQGNKNSVDTQKDIFYNEEMKKITDANGIGSTFLNRNIFSYSQFKPRGNYTKNDELINYFRCVKWLNSAPINIDDDNRFLASLLIAYWIKDNKTCTQDYSTFNSVIGMLSGEEDNYSINHLIKILNDNRIDKIEDLCKPQNISNIKNQLQRLDLKQMPNKAGNEIAKEELSKKYILFTAGRYTFDSEILVRLVHVLRPNPKRPFPKGLDVFAALGNQTAKDILFKEFKEIEKWPEYSDSLSLVTSKFINYDNWNESIYNKTLECINSINFRPTNEYPVFMRTNYWQKKNLNTSLAAWSELKHDMILYTDQPWAAECGEGGGPPPPIHLSYVEPNVSFWRNAIGLLDYQNKSLSNMGLFTEESKEINSELKELANFLLIISNKELLKEHLTEKEFSELSWIGGRIEGLTFKILHTDHFPEREKQIAVIADVYSYNDIALEEAVGTADEIYVIAEINGLPYLTKGACFSYYEFQNNSRLTDEEWQRMIASGNISHRPDWLNELYVETQSLKSKPGHSFEDYVEHK